jgi:hypothetical protein
MDLNGKKFIGYIIDMPDPLNLGRYAVYIPNMMAFNMVGTRYIWCKNAINTYSIHRDPITKKFYKAGQYIPLPPGTKVIVEFLSNSLEQGYITGVDGFIPTKDRDNYYLVYETLHGSKFYVDDKRDILHIQHSDGLTNIFLSKDNITLQLNQNNSSGEIVRNSAIVIDENRIQFVVKNQLLEFSVDGLKMILDDENTKTFLSITQEGMNLSANKFINFNVEDGRFFVNSKDMFLTGLNESHIWSNDLRLTGSQKAQLSGTTINIQGFLDIHLKSLNINEEALVSYNLRTMMYNADVFGAMNTYASVYSLTAQVNSTANSMNAQSGSLNASDGVSFENMGVGSSAAGSINGAMNVVATSMYFGNATVGTALLMNEPTGAMAATNMVLSSTIAGSAEQAPLQIPIPLPEIPNPKDQISGLVNHGKKLEEEAKYNTIPDEIFKF